MYAENPEPSTRRRSHTNPGLGPKTAHERTSSAEQPAPSAGASGDLHACEHKPSIPRGWQPVRVLGGHAQPNSRVPRGHAHAKTILGFPRPIMPARRPEPRHEHEREIRRVVEVQKQPQPLHFEPTLMARPDLGPPNFGRVVPLPDESRWRRPKRGRQRRSRAWLGKLFAASSGVAVLVAVAFWFYPTSWLAASWDEEPFGEVPWANVPWTAAAPPSHDYELSSLTDYSLWHTAWVQDQLPGLIQADDKAEKEADKAKSSRAPRPSFRPLPVHQQVKARPDTDSQAATESEPSSAGRFRNPY